MDVTNLLIPLLRKDPLTYEHGLRVGRLAEIMVSYYVPGLSDQEKRSVIAGCCVHDIGKAMVPLNILNKTSALTPDEWQIIKRHTEIGARLLTKEGIADETVFDIVKYHHERWDGRGYPYGMVGNEIPVYARICSIIDAFDSMVSDRPYRKGLSVQAAKEELFKQSWSQFDGFYVTQFLNLPEKVLLPSEPPKSIRVPDYSILTLR